MGFFPVFFFLRNRNMQVGWHLWSLHFFHFFLLFLFRLRLLLWLFNISFLQSLRSLGEKRERKKRKKRWEKHSVWFHFANVLYKIESHKFQRDDVFRKLPGPTQSKRIVSQLRKHFTGCKCHPHDSEYKLLLCKFEYRYRKHIHHEIISEWILSFPPSGRWER